MASSLPSSVVAKTSHNINTEHPLLPIISMSFRCQVTPLPPSHKGWSALAAVRSALSTSTGHGGAGRFAAACLAGERMED